MLSLTQSSQKKKRGDSLVKRIYHWSNFVFASMFIFGSTLVEKKKENQNFVSCD